MNTILNKTKTSLAILLILTLSIVSCSDDDSPQEEAQLILSTSTTEVETDQEITFEVTANGKKVTDAEIYIDGTAIAGLKHSFTEKGDYFVVAKKGNNTSEALAIAVFKSVYDVYAVGYELNQSYQLTPKYWKNGEAIDLISDNPFIPTSIYVTNNDEVYATGEGFSNNTSIAVYWKNSVETTIESGTSAKSIYVLNNDIYIAGSENNTAKYWKNGEATTLTDGEQETKAKAIFVTEKGDIYVAGDASGGGFVRFGKYWKNGEEISLNDSGSISIESIYVTENDDVYLAGQEFDETKSKYVAKYWKNGKAISLTDGTYSALAKSIYVTNNDVYIVGFETDINYNNIARYWKNGKEIALTDGSKRSEANSIKVTDRGDVYISGFEYNDIYSVAKYWKNGNEVVLTDGENSATSSAIFVVNKKDF